jgi:hypothetical protein
MEIPPGCSTTAARNHGARAIRLPHFRVFGPGLFQRAQRQRRLIAEFSFKPRRCYSLNPTCRWNFYRRAVRLDHRRHIRRHHLLRHRRHDTQRRFDCVCCAFFSQFRSHCSGHRRRFWLQRQFGRLGHLQIPNPCRDLSHHHRRDRHVQRLDQDAPAGSHTSDPDCEVIQRIVRCVPPPLIAAQGVPSPVCPRRPEDAPCSLRDPHQPTISPCPHRHRSWARDSA